MKFLQRGRTVFRPLRILSSVADKLNYLPKGVGLQKKKNSRTNIITFNFNFISGCFKFLRL